MIDFRYLILILIILMMVFIILLILILSSRERKKSNSPVWIGLIVGFIWGMLTYLSFLSPGKINVVLFIILIPIYIIGSAIFGLIGATDPSLLFSVSIGALTGATLGTLIGFVIKKIRK